MNKTFYSQNQEDKWLVENKIVPKKGFFLDIGAGDWAKNSNTLYFEKHGWDGICVEADIRHIPGLIKNRKRVVCGAIVPKNSLRISDFFMNSDRPDLSGINIQGKGEILQTASLYVEDLINKYSIRKIDLLSLDIEGIEARILYDIFANHLFPKVIVVEYKTLKVNNFAKIDRVMRRQPYKRITKTRTNYIYKLNRKAIISPKNN